jgi:hypothetical protein
MIVRINALSRVVSIAKTMRLPTFTSLVSASAESLALFQHRLALRPKASWNPFSASRQACFFHAPRGRLSPPQMGARIPLKHRG